MEFASWISIEFKVGPIEPDGDNATPFTVDAQPIGEKLAASTNKNHRLVGEEQWSTVYSSSSRLTLEGLESFRDYEFRAAYIGRGVNPTARFGETLTSIVL